MLIFVTFFLNFIVIILFSSPEYSVVSIAVFSLINGMREFQIRPLPLDSGMLLYPDNPRHKSIVSDQKREGYLIGHGHLEHGRIIRMVHKLKVVVSGQLEFDRESGGALLTPIAAHNGSVLALSVIANDLD